MYIHDEIETKNTTIGINLPHSDVFITKVKLQQYTNIKYCHLNLNYNILLSNKTKKLMCILTCITKNVMINAFIFQIFQGKNICS